MTGLVEHLRDGTWFTQERVVAYAAMALACHAGAAAYLVLAGHGWLDVYGRPIGGDFLCFFAAGVLALKGQAASVYDFPVHIAQQAALIGGADPYYFLWLYPPLFLLPMSALALMPYGAALFVWLAGTAAGYVIVLRRIVTHRHTLLVALAWPGFFDNLQHGQNAFLSAALLGGGVLLLDRRPILAGILFGALLYKPQLACLVPVALLAGRRWRALGALIAATLVLSGISALVFGSGVWSAFQSSRHMTEALLEGEHGAYYAKIGLFSAVRLAGGPVPLAWSLQLICALSVAVMVMRVWGTKVSVDLKGALLVAATPLISPWFNQYDLVILAVPAAWLIREGLQRGFLPWERLVLAVGSVAPILTFAFAWATHIQLAPLVEIAFVWLILRRMRESGPSQSEQGGLTEPQA